MLDLISSDRESFDVEIAYWKEKLQGVTPLNLATDVIRGSGSGIEKATASLLIEGSLEEELTRLSREQGVSLFLTLLAAFEVLLYRYSNQEDICVGHVVPGKPPGSKVQLLALRTELTGTDRFSELLKRVKNTTVEAYQHQKVPFEKVVESLSADMAVGEHPLFQVIFVLMDETLDRASLSAQTQGYDLVFILNKTPGGIAIEIEYTTGLYQQDMIERMGAHYSHLLRSVTEDPEQNIGSLTLLSPSERNELLVQFNATLVAYPAEKTLHDLFEEQVARTPEGIALRQHEATLSYRELNERSNQLARHLVAHGVKPGDNIGLLVTRGFDMIIGMYGILKAGGAYVPIDPDYPLERQEYILSNSAVSTVIADGDYPLGQSVAEEEFIRLGRVDLGGYATTNLGIAVDSKQLAYTIYTSGSTGRPKGVMIEHHSAVNLVLWVNQEFEIGERDRILFITSMCFDLSVYDIFGMLASGGSLVIVEQQELLDVPRLKEMMIQYRITFWDSVPTTMDYLVRELEAQDKGYLQETLRVVFMSGDWIPVNLPDRIKKYFPNTRVISLGGATEGTVWSNYYPVEKVESNWTSIPYGRPMNNNFFYILNDQLQPVPIGVPGELYIGGVGVARGYANDKEKTDYSFVKDPFNDQAGGRMYRTGDLGRMLPGMNMEFIGRKDDQVKIRGYRIELGEIESVLRQSELISQAVVLARADKEGKKRLIGYVVGQGQYDRETVIAYLKSKLPDYMVPTLWVELDALPLTSNGKIDKKALPDFDAQEQLKDQYTAPVTESEKALAGIWQEVLKLKSVGLNDNFFDIGGHSLLAVQIITRIGDKIGKKLPISVLFEYPTIHSLNIFLEKDNAAANWKSLVPIKSTGNKMPLYIVHGEGLNVLNFNSLALYVDDEQPVFGLQAKGLDGIETPLDNIPDIAKHYLSEIIEHNPSGPYAIAGYSLGGFIAFEMVRQLEQMNKEVKMLAIFDTDAEYDKHPWLSVVSKKIQRHLPKFMGGSRSLPKQINYIIRQKTNALIHKLGLNKKSESNGFYTLVDNIKKKQLYALKNYKLTPLNSTIYLFRAIISVHFTDDINMGWRKFSSKDIENLEVPGDHISMLLLPNVTEFADVLQHALDNC